MGKASGWTIRLRSDISKDERTGAFFDVYHDHEDQQSVSPSNLHPQLDTHVYC